MNPAAGHSCTPFLVFALALLGAACNETKTPTEPAAVAATPTPTPGPAGLASLSGTIRDQAGVPYGGAAAIYCGNVSTQTKASPVGHYEFSGLPSGHSKVAIYAQGQDTPQRFEIDLQVGPNTHDFAIVIVRGEPATMAGRVKFASGRTASDLRVYCQGQAAVSAAPDGTYLYPGLMAGRWDVFIGWDGYNGEYYTTVTLNPGANTVDFTIPE
jgi:hypothetical protein